MYLQMLKENLCVKEGYVYFLVFKQSTSSKVSKLHEQINC